MRYLAVILTLALSIPLLACLGQDRRTEQEQKLLRRLQGLWRLTEAAGKRPDGKVDKTAFAKGPIWMIHKNFLYFHDDYGNPRSIRLEIDASSEPVRVDLIEQPDLEKPAFCLLGILSLEKDRLYICSHHKLRPQSFDLKDEADFTRMWIFERFKEQD
jgi:uncharacterized protein (TIGR03067 family)